MSSTTNIPGPRSQHLIPAFPRPVTLTSAESPEQSWKVGIILNPVFLRLTRVPRLADSLLLTAGVRKSSTGIPGSLRERQSFRPHPHLLGLNLQFNKTPRGFVPMAHFKRHCPRSQNHNMSKSEGKFNTTPHPNIASCIFPPIPHPWVLLPEETGACLALLISHGQDAKQMSRYPLQCFSEVLF